MSRSSSEEEESDDDDDDNIELNKSSGFCTQHLHISHYSSPRELCLDELKSIFTSFSSSPLVNNL